MSQLAEGWKGRIGFSLALIRITVLAQSLRRRAAASRGRFIYFATAANRSECSNDWNCLSSLLKCISRSELSEFTVTLSSAIFSVGVAVIFL